MSTTELNSLHSEKIVQKVIDLVIKGNGELPSGITEERIAQMVKEKIFINETVQEMCRDREAAKLTINISEHGTISPEITLKGTAAVNYLLEKKK